MKFFTTPITCLLFFYCTAGKSDEKLLKQANEQIGKRDFQNAAVRLEQVSEQGKATVDYLQAASLVYDSLKDYKKAINLYELLLQEKSSTAIVERINFLRTQQAATDETERALLEKRKNCTKCKGTGYYEATVRCPRCNGAGRITKDCPRCNGTGKIMCTNCQGTGRIEIVDPKTGTATISICNRCMGTGHFECNNMCSQGKITEDCMRCGGLGTVVQQVKCDLHP